MSQPTTDQTYLKRVQALLDKAESTPYQAEAEALIAKAQELMGRHAIDEAMLADAGKPTDEIVPHLMTVSAPYANAKSLLLGSIANANRCRVVTGSSSGGKVYATVIGHRTDVDTVEILYTALSLQAVRFMVAATVPPHDTPRRFRHSFLLAYALRIGERLQEVDRAAQADAERDQITSPAGASGRSVSVVLASREKQVDKAVADAFPHLRTRRVQSSSGAGHASGRSAANRASLGGPGLGGSTTRGLPGG